MPLCPLYSNRLTKACFQETCYNYVPTLDFNCLALHCSIYKKEPSEVLTILYGKSYKMMVALAIKAMRVAYAIKELKPSPTRTLGTFEKVWVNRIKKAGPLNPSLTWVETVKQNMQFLFLDRMAQVLNTMDIYDYSLQEVVNSYKTIFGSLDLKALSIREDEVEKLQF